MGFETKTGMQGKVLEFAQQAASFKLLPNGGLSRRRSDQPEDVLDV